MVDRAETDLRLSRRPAAHLYARAMSPLVLRPVSDGSAPSDLVLVLIHSAGALRRRHDAILALRQDQSRLEVRARAVGDSTQAVLSLFLAADAANRYCQTHDEVGPLGEPRLDELETITRYMRDTIMHWQEKGKRDPLTYLAVDESGVSVRAPDGKWGADEGALSGVSWSAFECRARALLQWSAGKLGQDPAADELGMATAWPWLET